MGTDIVCGTCGMTVYTSGDRMPAHDDADGQSCPNRHLSEDPEEYVLGFDNDYWVYQGGAWELGKNR